MNLQGAGERVFYETLLKEKPESDIALVWAIEHGTLSKDEAAKRYQEYEKAKQRLRLQTFSSNSQPQKSSTKTAASASSATSSPATKKQKKSSNKDAGKVVDTTAVSAGDVGMNVGGDEGVGTVNLG